MIAAQYETVRITVPPTDSQDSVLTPQAIQFLLKLSAAFEARRRQLLKERQARQRQIDEGWQPDFPAETAEIRQAPWKVAAAPADLLDRRVEITGPTSRKMVSH